LVVRSQDDPVIKSIMSTIAKPRGDLFKGFEPVIL
jgi:hypothetical protein